MAARTIATALIRFRADVSRFSPEVRKAAMAAGLTAREFTRLQAQVRRFNIEAAETVRRVGLLGGALGAVAVGASLRQYARLEETLASVRGISSATRNEFEALQESALSLGRTTRFTSQQVAEGQLFLARAGFQVDQIVSALPGTLRLAQAATLELGSAADIVSNVLTAFRQDAAQTDRFVDVLAATANRANTDLIQLGDAMSYVASTSAALDVSVEETGALIGTLSDAGIQSSRAGTALRAIFNSLLAPTGAAAVALRNYGLALADVNPESVNAITVLRRLSAANVSASDAVRIFGERQADAFLAIQANIEGVVQLNEELGNSAGEAAELARLQDDTLRGSYLRLRSAAEGLGLALVDQSGAATGLRSVLDSLSATLNIFSDNSGRVLPVLQQLAAVVGAVVLSKLRFIRVAGNAVLALTAIRGGAQAAAAAVRSLGRALILPAIVEGVVLIAQHIGRVREESMRTARAVAEMQAEMEDFASTISDLDRAGAASALANIEGQIVNLQSTLTAINAGGDRGFLLSLIGLDNEAVREVAARISDLEDRLTNVSDARARRSLNQSLSNAQAEFDQLIETYSASLVNQRDRLFARLNQFTDDSTAAVAGGVGRDAEEALRTSRLAIVALREFYRDILNQQGADLAKPIIRDLARVDAAQDRFKQRLRETVTVQYQNTEAARAYSVWLEHIGRLQDEASSRMQQFGAVAGNVFNILIDRASTFADRLRSIARAVASGLAAYLASQTDNPFLQGFLGTFQTGGRTSGAGVALVGEAGPELVQLDRPARVISNEQIREAVGEGGGINVNFNVASGVSEEQVRSTILEFGPQLVATISAAIGRPGLLRTAVQQAARV